MDLITWRSFSTLGQEALVCLWPTTSSKMRMAGVFTHMSVSVLLYHTTKTSQGMLWNWHFAGSKTISFSRKGMIQRKQISKKNRRASSSLHLLPPPAFPLKVGWDQKLTRQAYEWEGWAFIRTECLSLWQKARVGREGSMPVFWMHVMCFNVCVRVYVCVRACVCMSLNKSNWLWIISEFLTEQNGDLSDIRYPKHCSFQYLTPQYAWPQR